MHRAGPVTHPKSSQNKYPGQWRTLGVQGLESHRIKIVNIPAFILSSLAAVFGMLGALLLAMPAYPGWGFGAFLVSNIGWLTVSAWQRQWPLHVQQWVFLGCSLLGLWNWWLGPLVLG